MTLDGLDQAFDDGLIDARVPVLAPGSSAWTTLGEAAGLDDDVVEETPSLSPIAMPSSDSLASMGALPTSAESGPDLDIPDDVDFGRRPRGVLIGIIPGMLAVAAALVVVVSKLGGTVPADVKVTNAVQAPAAAADVLPPLANVAPAAPAPAIEAAAPAAEAATAKPALSEWQKQLLEANDKAREAQAQAKAREKAVAPKPKPAPKANPGLLNGGDRFDPLNGAL